MVYVVGVNQNGWTGRQPPLCLETTQMNYTVIIADLSESRARPTAERNELQGRLDATVAGFNRTFAPATASRFDITLGDEFQAVLTDPTVIPGLALALERDFPDQRFRLGVGHGPVATEVNPDPGRMDGPAFHNARLAITRAKKERRKGVVFEGFGPIAGDSLNALSELAAYVRAGWTSRQREVADGLRSGLSQVALSERLGISKQAVSKHSTAAGWPHVRRAELALARVLSEFRSTP